jgi:hypothetical protein
VLCAYASVRVLVQVFMHALVQGSTCPCVLVHYSVGVCVHVCESVNICVYFCICVRLRYVYSNDKYLCLRVLRLCTHVQVCVCVCVCHFCMHTCV